MKHGCRISAPHPRLYRTHHSSIPAYHVFAVSPWVRPANSHLSTLVKKDCTTSNRTTERRIEFGRTFHVQIFMVLNSPLPFGGRA